MDGRDAVWGHPDLMPTADDLDDPEALRSGRARARPVVPGRSPAGSFRRRTTKADEDGDGKSWRQGRRRVSLRADAGRARGMDRADRRGGVLRKEFLEHLDAHEDAMWRECVPGHLTATTAVLSHDGERVLLTLHPKAGCGCPWAATASATTSSIEAAALREATEESGIPGLRLLPGPLALDRHRVWCHPPHS